MERNDQLENKMTEKINNSKLLDSLKDTLRNNLKSYHFIVEYLNKANINHFDVKEFMIDLTDLEVEKIVSSKGPKSTSQKDRENKEKTQDEIKVLIDNINLLFNRNMHCLNPLWKIN